MTTYEYIESVLELKREGRQTKIIDESAAYEAASLASACFTYPLYEMLWTNFFDMETLMKHMEYLYDSKNYYGLIYFMFILADAVDYSIPIQLTEMSANDALIPALAAAIIEDWFEYDGSGEVTEIDE